MRKRMISTLIAAGCLSFVVAFGQQLDKTIPFDASTYFIGDGQPVKADVTGNPLDYASARIGLDIRHIELPRGWEGGYRFACRFPIIDYVSNRPLYMKQWAEDNAGRITRAHAADGVGADGIGAVAAGLEILRGTANFPPISVLENRTSWAEVKKALVRSNFTGRYQSILLALYERYRDARFLVGQSRTNLTKEDLKFFNDNPAYFLCPDGKRMVDLTGNVETQFQFVERARRVGYEYIFSAAQLLAGAVKEYCAATNGFGKRDFFVDTTKAKENLEIGTGDDTLVIAGFGNDIHGRDAHFLIDLGGDDIYTNNAGGCHSVDDMVALCIDHAGNDRYQVVDKNFVQGFGFLGVGFLVDLAGDDSYQAHHFAQGAAIMGVGVLDDRAGNDTYDAEAFCQGAGMFGLGMVLDDAGDDSYDCATLGQGAATTLGLGILSDLAGDDRYQLAIATSKDALGQAPGYGQGGALSFRNMPWVGKLTAYGGVGMLVDHAGNDSYRSNGWNVQGGSYIMSLGVLVDDAGNDHYVAGTGQGSGIHITNAILIDKAGDDSYEGGFRAGGSGGDRSPGFLIDYQGNDTYKSATSSYGTGCKPFSCSLFLDYQGDDHYICSEPKDKIIFNNWDSFGGVWPESDPALWPYAIFLDLGGTDTYQVRNRQNNSERQSFGHGIFLDTEWKGDRALRDGKHPDVIGTVENPLEPYREFPLPAKVEQSRFYRDIKLLQNPDNFVRFQAVGRIVESGAAVVPVLVDALVNSSHRQFNRDLMECLHYFLTENKVRPADVGALVRLLKAPDEEVRTIIADDFGVFKLAAGEDALVDLLLTDSSASVRRFAIRSLNRLNSVKALSAVRKLAQDDPSEDVRRIAVSMVGRVEKSPDPVPVLVRALENDPASQVKVAAVDGLGHLQAASTLPALRAAAGSSDVYLQRAAGSALAALGQVEGIGVLIESLSFPSIDAFFNYDWNVPNVVAAYSNYDLPEDQRYDQDRWRTWFAANRDRIDIVKNGAAFRELTALTDSLRDASARDQVARYEKLFKRYPAYTRIGKTLAAKLNEVAWTMVTVPKGTVSSDPAQGLKFARRAVELDPQAGYYDTLAEALEANGQAGAAIDLCREMLKKFPNEKMFEDRLKRLEKK